MWSLTVGKALTVDLGMDRGGEACRGVAPGCWIPWVLGVWVSSGDVWLEGVGSESILEVKSRDSGRTSRLTVFVGLWIVAILFGGSTSLDAARTGFGG